MTTAVKQAKSVPPTEAPAMKAEPTVEEIRQRAYELYLFRGDRPGDALEDWLEAERELCAKNV
jgi:hypothetical protein